MKAYVEEFCKRRSYPKEAIRELMKCWDEISVVPEAMDYFRCAEARLQSGDTDVVARMELLNKVSELSGANRMTLHLLFYICETVFLKQRYELAGIGVDIYEDTVEDLKCKMYECYGLHGTWGCRVRGWLDGFFTLKKFALGRMQYEVRACEESVSLKCGLEIKEGDLVVVMHVPVSDKPFSRAARQESYEKAYQFFKNQFPDGRIPFRVVSWLLFPENEKLLPAASNIIDFMHEFDIVKRGIYPNHEELWRIFGEPYHGDAASLKRDTSVQRAYADWVAAGNETGYGVGYFIYDGKTFIK